MRSIFTLAFLALLGGCGGYTNEAQLDTAIAVCGERGISGVKKYATAAGTTIYCNSGMSAYVFSDGSIKGEMK